MEPVLGRSVASIVVSSNVSVASLNVQSEMSTLRSVAGTRSLTVREEGLHEILATSPMLQLIVFSVSSSRSLSTCSGDTVIELCKGMHRRRKTFSSRGQLYCGPYIRIAANIAKCAPLQGGKIQYTHQF